MATALEFVRAELAVDGHGDPASKVCELLLAELSDFDESAIFIENDGGMSLEVTHQGQRWSRSAAISRFESWLAELVDVAPVRFVVLDDLTVRNFRYLDTSELSFDVDRVLREVHVGSDADTTAAGELLHSGASFRTIAFVVNADWSAAIGDGRTLSTPETAALVQHIEHVIVSAFDGEGFVALSLRQGAKNAATTS